MVKKNLYANAILIAIGIVGLFFTFIAFWYPYALKKAETKIRFEQASHQVNVKLQETLNSSIEVILSLKAFYDSSEFVTREEFKTFASTLLQKNTAIRALEWLPRVYQSQRTEFEAKAQKIFPNFTIMEMDDQGKLVTAPERPEYFPIFYIEPFEANRIMWGYNSASSPVRNRALIKALNSGKGTTTEPIKLIQIEKEPLGFLIIFPVYKQHLLLNTLEKKQTNFLGFVTGVLNFDELFQSVYQNINEDNITTDLFINNKHAYTYEPTKRATNAFVYRTFDQVGDKTWTLVYTPCQGFFNYSPPFASYLFGLAGLLTTGLVLVYLMSIAKRSHEIDKIVDERTNELSIAKKDAENANQLKTRYLTILSHEFKNPLHAIIGLSKMLAEEVPKEHLETVKHIRSSGQHLLELVNTTVNLPKIEEDKIEFLPEKIDLIPLIEESYQLVAFRLKQKELQYSFEHEMPSLKLITDPQKIRQILVNLLSNAIKYTESGQIKITLTQEASLVKIAVTDTGRGINPEKIKELFNPYVQAGENLDEKYVGTGLGLWITKKLLEACHGSIDVKSEKGVGSTFTVTLPLTPMSS